MHRFLLCLSIVLSSALFLNGVSWVEKSDNHVSVVAKESCTLLGYTLSGEDNDNAIYSTAPKIHPSPTASAPEPTQEIFVAAVWLADNAIRAPPLS